MRTSTLLLLGLGLVGFTGGASANSVFLLNPSSTLVDPSTPVTVDVYLQLDGAELATVQGDNGLWSAGVELSLSSTTSLNPALITNVTGNSLFTDPLTPGINSDPITGTWSVVNFMDFFGASGLIPDPVNGVWTLKLGTFDITASPDSGQTTVFNAAAVSPNTTVTFTNLYSVDPAGTSPTFSISTNQPAVVPVPSSLWTGFALLTVLAGLRLARRQALA